MSTTAEHMWDAETGLHKLTQEMIDGAIYKGFLKKQGANWKTWRNRYFVLTEDVLYYLPSERAEVPLGAIVLAQAVIEGADETIDKPWCFLVKPKKSYTGTTEWSGRTYYLQATDYVDLNKWIDALLSFPIRLSQQISYRPAVFHALQAETETTALTSPPAASSPPVSVRGDAPRRNPNRHSRSVRSTSEYYTESTSLSFSSSEETLEEDDKTPDDGDYGILDVSFSM